MPGQAVFNSTASSTATLANSGNGLRGWPGLMSNGMTTLKNDNLRLWVGHFKGSPAGYFELQNVAGDIQIAYFGLAQPFIGKGLGGALLSKAIREAWDWGAKRVWVHTCSLDHPFALKNYQARGLKIYKKETK